LEEIEVSDSSHPLFGRRFKIHRITRGKEEVARVYVEHTGSNILMIPLRSTNLSSLVRSAPAVKINAIAANEFIAIAKEYQLWPALLETFGQDSR
jgi:hypothetical protein